MKPHIRSRVGYSLWFGLLLAFSWLMWLITVQYIPARNDVAFLRVKTDVAGLLHYRVAFFAHVYSAMLALVGGMIQFSPLLRKRLPKLHRISGRIYVAVILLVSGPTGLIMGYYGNGGIVAQTAFCLLAVLWMYFTWQGFATARVGNISAHRKWMYRSYALTLSAISLRLWKWLLVYLFEPRPMDVYHVVAWLGWVGNLVVAELILFYIYRKSEARASL